MVVQDQQNREMPINGRAPRPSPWDREQRRRRRMPPQDPGTRADLVRIIVVEDAVGTGDIILTRGN